MYVCDVFFLFFITSHNEQASLLERKLLEWMLRNRDPGRKKIRPTRKISCSTFDETFLESFLERSNGFRFYHMSREKIENVYISQDRSVHIIFTQRSVLFTKL